MAMPRSFLLLFIISSMAIAQSNSCPYGWPQFGSRCYKFFPQQINWVAAQRNCRIFGANLVSVHSHSENNFLLNLMPSPSTNAWTGAHDGEMEGQWLWTDGTGYDYSNWCSGEPNNKGVENCLMLSWTSNRCWNDATCSSSMGSICVKDL